MIDELKKNVETQIDMLKEISSYTGRIKHAETGQERKLLQQAVESLRRSMATINRSLPDLLRDISVGKSLPSKAASHKKIDSKLERIAYKGVGGEVHIVLNKQDKEKLLKELSISERLFRRIRKEEKDKDEEFSEFKASRGYLKLANRFFLERAGEVTDKGYFNSLSIGLRKANIDVLFKSYVAMIFLTTFISIFVGIFLLIFLLFFNVSAIFPFVSLFDGSYLTRFFQLIWIPFVVPVATFLALYFYPGSEQKSIGKKIDQELPFAVIHMSAISGSGIAPSEIFKIIGMNKEYKYLRKEIRKVLNQINLYGYDLVTALNNASRSSPSEKLSDLFSGLSTSITSGADLSEFLEKRAGSLLLSYRLEREQYTKLVETFLDIYISIVIAAPMIFLLLVIMMMVSGIEVGFSSAQISLLAVFGIAILNVVFLVILQMKQPSY
jgi:archaeal flagellar protein FlaJ